MSGSYNELSTQFAKRAKTFALQRDAENWAKSIELAMDRGTWAPAQPGEKVTLLEALTRYQSEIAAKKRGASQERSVLAALGATKLSKQTLASVRGADLARLRDEWLSEFSPATVIKRLNTLSAVYQTAKKEWGFEGLDNPVEHIKKPSAPAGRDRRVEDEEDSEGRRIASSEIERLLAASSSPLLRGAVELALETAMRRGELCKLTWPMVDLKNRVIYLPGSITKNGQSREVPLSSKAVAVLQALPHQPADKPLLGIRADGLTQAFIRAQARARKIYEDECRETMKEPAEGFLVGLRFHDLRHEATSRLASVYDAATLAKVTGWKTLGMILRYYHPRGADLAKMLA
jgi:integrase